MTTGSADTHVAFRVDRLKEIVSLSAEQLENTEESLVEHISGIAKYKSLSINLLDPSEIIASLSVR